MAQEDVYKLLRKRRKPLLVKEIAKILRVNTQIVTCNLNRMLKFDEVEKVPMRGIVKNGRSGYRGQTVYAYRLADKMRG